MFHYFEAITNTKGDSLVGYFVRVIDPVTGNVVTLAADEGGTPIITVSGVVNMAKTDDAGNASFYVAYGSYNLDIYAPDAATFVSRVTNVDMGEAANVAGNSADIAAANAALTASDRTQTGLDRVATGADRTQTGLDRVQTGSDRASATASASFAATASATVGAYPNTATANVPRGLTQGSVGAITAGSGGTNGTFALAWSSGNFSINPTGTFTVAGGVLTAVTITGPGLYIGASPTVPTPSFAASSGLTGAAVALTAQFLVASGAGYWVQALDGKSLLRYYNSSGTATADAGISGIANKVYVDSVATSVSGVTNTTLKYTGSDPIKPLIINTKYQLLLGIELISGRRVGPWTSSTPAATPTLLPTSSAPVRTKRMIVIVNGQSLGDGTNAVPVLSGSVPNGYSNLTFRDGPRSIGPTNAASFGKTDGTVSETALVETTYIGVGNQASAGETTCSAAGNYATFRRLGREGGLPSDIKFCASAPAWPSQPVENIRLGQGRYTSFQDHVNGWASRAVAAGETYSFLAMTYHGGEINTTDNTVAHDRATYAAQIQGLFNETRASMKTKSGQSWDPHVGVWQPAYATINGGSANPVTPGAIQLGQFDVINSDPLTHFIGPNFFLVDGSDHLHWTNESQKWAGFYEGRWLDDLLRGRVPQRLWPLSATVNGTTVTIQFEVTGQGPLQLRPDILFATTDYGVKVVDGTGTLTLSNFQTGDDTLSFTINRTLGTNPKVRAGLDYAGVGQTGSGYAVHNICDSSPDTCVVNSVTKTMFNVAPQFELAITSASTTL